jgi:hypothetical protein
MTTAEAVAMWLIVAICIWQLFYLTRAWRVWTRFRGDHVVTCPETDQPAAVRLDVSHAATTALLAGTPVVRLAQCSRWPWRGRCDQPCLPEAQEPESRVTAIVTRWCKGKSCVFCGRVIGEVDFLDHRPALLGPDGQTVQWTDVPPEWLPRIFRSHRPVCWNCHVAETFRRMHPELVTARERR